MKVSMSKDHIIQIEGKPLCLLYRALCTGILFVISTLTLTGTAQNLTGISGNVVTLDDREDHNWSYYSDKPDSDYPDILNSPNPRNVKIIYDGNGGAVSYNETQNEFIYYKTIEKINNAYTYKVIPNPFSKRPTVGTGNNRWRGFGGWKIISGGEYINGHNNNDILTLEETLTLTGLDNGYTKNCLSATIELQATWVQAYVSTVNAAGNISARPNGLNGDTYETNFIVILDNRNHTVSGTGRVTISNRYPDGSSGGTGTVSGCTTANDGTKVEFTNISGTFTERTGQLIVGRGCTGTVSEVTGTNNDRVKDIRLESGTYSFVHPMQGMGDNDANRGNFVFGCDYDRAQITTSQPYGDNSKLRIVVFTAINGSGGHANYSNQNPTSSTLDLLNITVKSGYYGFTSDFASWQTNKNDGWGLGIGGNTDNFNDNYTVPDANGVMRTYNYRNNKPPQNTMSFYVGPTRGGGKGGKNYLLIEGGELSSINGGGTTTANEFIRFDFRMTGGWVKGAIYGGASATDCNGSSKIVITGGEVNSWIGGGCNGTDIDAGAGATNGTIYIYAGGNAQIRSHNSDGVYNNAWGLVNHIEGGQIFGGGRGMGAPGSYSGSATKAYVVVADESFVEQNVYGGSCHGVSQDGYVYILGGTVGKKVFGGSFEPTSTNQTWQAKNTYVRMYGGLVKGGIYGGNDADGTVTQNAQVLILGGQTGVDASNTADIHGGGYGSSTRVNGNVDVTIGAVGQATANAATIFGDVYGGSALGTVNDATSDHTYVTLNAGTIYGSLYGGGLGDLASLGVGHSNVAANVNGPVAVKVYGGSVIKTDNNPGGVFGANNLNGAPQSSVTVDIYSTDAAPSDDSYAINAVYGGGNQADYINNSYPTVTVHNGGSNNSIGYVYGGGNAARVQQTQVKVYGGNKIGNVFGGGNGTDGPAPVTNNSNVDIYGGTILNVFGGSNTAGLIGRNVTINVNEQAESGYDLRPVIITNVYGGGNKADVTGNVIVDMLKGKVIGDIYGGGALANTNIGNATNYGAANESITSTDTYTTTLNLKGGTVGNAYGGGLGDADHAALVYGNVSVLLDGSAFIVQYEGEGDARKAVSGRLFGCNNVNGTPKGSVTVTVEKTVGEGGSLKPDKGTNTYELAAVYGGGNEAEYLPNILTNAKPVVIINGCDDTSIEYVYGGGNAASVPATDVTVNGCYEIGWVFGGGNGKDALANGNLNPGANVGYHAYTIPEGSTDEQVAAIKTAASYGSGETSVKLFGGTIHNAFGGSNTKGNVKVEAEVTLDHPEDDSNQCTLLVDNVFGAGNEAPMDGTANIILGCVDYLNEIYGGANQADLNSDVVLTIQSGSFGRVFGGNNVSGDIKGTITVNIEETGCKPIIIGELYGGGNQAPYTAPSGEHGPTVNVKSFTSIGKVFGGGLGAAAVVTGDTYVNIEEAIISTDKEHSKQDYTGEEMTLADGSKITPPDRPADPDGAMVMGVIGEVYGGGNAAKVDGNTYVNIATLETVDFESLSTDNTKPVEGANIVGNIYGGGNEAEVTGKPTVTIGKQQ